MGIMNKLAFLWLALAICAAEEIWPSKAKDLTHVNISTAIPSPSPAIVMFYNLGCEHCKNKSAVLDELITAYAISQPDVHFYRIDGPANPTIIESFTDIKDYPSLAFFDPQATTVSNVFTEKWELNEMQKWAETCITQSKTKKTTAPSQVVYQFDPKMCEGYEKANKLCDGYEKMSKEMSELKRGVAEAKAKMVELSHSMEKKEEPKVVAPAEEKSSWVGGLLIFLAGGFVGFLLCYALFMRVNSKRARTTI